MRAALGLFLAFAASAALAAPSGPPASVRATVEAGYAEAMKAMYDETDPDSPRPGPPPGAMYKAIDINRDGKPDWRVDYANAKNPSLFCGTGGCEQQIFISRPDGSYALVFERLVRQFKVSTVKGERVLDVDFHGTICEGTGVEECNRRYAWDEASVRFLERPNRKGDSWLVSGPAPVFEPPLTATPAAVQAQVERRQELCKAAGGTYIVQDNTLNDLPDLNGDGVREWLVGSYYSGCDMGESGKDNPVLPMTILASRPDGGFDVALEVSTVSWGIDLAAPVRFFTLEGEDCGMDTPCTRVPWIWDGQRLVRTP